MTYRLLTSDEKAKIIELMESAGFVHFPHDAEIADLMTGLYFQINASQQDKQNAVSYLAPVARFIPFNYRSVSVFANYVTSNLTGKIKGKYRRTWQSNYDTANIFAYAKNADGTDNDPVEAVRIFLGMYARLEYNRSGV